MSVQTAFQFTWHRAKFTIARKFASFGTFWFLLSS